MGNTWGHLANDNRFDIDNYRGTRAKNSIPRHLVYVLVTIIAKRKGKHWTIGASLLKVHESESVIVPSTHGRTTKTRGCQEPLLTCSILSKTRSLSSMCPLPTRHCFSTLVIPSLACNCVASAETVFDHKNNNAPHLDKAVHDPCDLVGQLRAGYRSPRVLPVYGINL